MDYSLSYARTGWLLKFSECVLAAVAIFNLLLIPLEFMPASFWEKYGQYYETGLLGTIGVAVLGSIGYTWVWQRREAIGRINSGVRHAWLQGIIRYWLALSISTYGFAKILKTQFQTPSYRLDMPLGEVNGFGLTWYYFGYSYTLAVILALFQIGGSILLLYRRTTLLGVMILLPVMVNIVLINLFYDIATGAFFNSIVFTLSLIFFLLLDVKKLKVAFWDLVERLPPVTLGRNWVKHGLRVLPIALAFAIIESFLIKDKTDKVLLGTWKIERFTRNGRVFPPNAWLTDTTAWSRVYFEGWQGCAFSPNPYRYRPAESFRGNYEFDSTTNKLQVVFYSNKDQKKDTLQAAVSQRTAKAMHVHGVLHRDTLDMQLARIR